MYPLLGMVVKVKGILDQGRYPDPNPDQDLGLPSHLRDDPLDHPLLDHTSVDLVGVPDQDHVLLQIKIALLPNEVHLPLTCK